MFGVLDAFDVVGDPLSIVIGRANGLMGTTSSRGLVTIFTVDIVPIPEPSTTALLFLGLLALGWKRHRSRKPSPTQS
jgi:hypothetical protein